MEDKPPYPIVLVEWSDAHAGESGWVTLEDYEDEGDCIVSSVGFLVPAEEKGGKEGHVTLWQTYHDGEAINPFHIPVGMVKKMMTLNT